jgi:chromosomal replication initiator protein
VLAQSVLDLLKEEIPTNDYQKYIRQLKYIESESSSGEAVFSVPNRLLVRWIETKYSDKIAHLFELKTQIKTKISIKVSNQISHVKKQKNKEKVKTNYADSILLNPINTFEKFVVGSTNQVAYNVAKAVSEKPGINYNPLFLYGLSGLGKTHLLQSVGNEAIKAGKNVIYITSEQFMNDFTFNLRNQTPDKFRKKYRECDYLLIDDIQFLSGKEQTQEEFFHTFNELHQNQKQIILTSDKPPKKIAGFEDRLKSRFEWGMIIDIQPPGLETKIAIIQSKCELNDLELDAEIIEYIASSMGENVREIESAITTIKTFSNMMHQNITLSFAKDVLKDMIKETKETITLENIIDVISKELNVKPSDIKSKKRSRIIVEARRIGIYLARNLTPNSMPQLAQYFGMKDHTAVSHTMKSINKLIDENENFKLRVEELKNKILTEKK